MFDLLDEFYARFRLKTVGAGRPRNFEKAAAGRTFSRCSGIDQTQLAWLKHRAVFATGTAYVLSTKGKKCRAIVSSGPFLGPAITVFASVRQKPSTRAAYRWSSARVGNPAGGVIHANARSTWPTFA